MIEDAASQIDAKDRTVREHTDSIRRFAAEVRKEITPPADDLRPRTRDEIPAREWAEYEWHDATAFGDKQRKYVRGLKR
jgi:hypothetical protein